MIEKNEWYSEKKPIMGLIGVDLFVKFRPGQFTVPRFSSLSGALMCDS